MKISQLQNNEVFVFGSNLSGIHGAGGAKDAMKWGAKYGVYEGLSGQTYAIPTKDADIKLPLDIEIIRKYVERFISFAKTNNNLVFLVTEIGCGLSGYRVSDIAPLFYDAFYIPNIKLPDSFRNYLQKYMDFSSDQTFKVIIAGSRDFDNYKLLEEYCDKVLVNQKNIEIVSGTARGADTLAIHYAHNRGYKLTEFPANWDKFGKSAGYKRNVQMAEYANACIVFMKKEGTKGSQHMIDIAKRKSLKLKVVLY